jgi:hypothetical protein
MDLRIDMNAQIVTRDIYVVDFTDRNKLGLPTITYRQSRQIDG